MRNSILKKIIVSITSVLIAVLAGSLIMILCGYAPLPAYNALFKGAFGNINSIMTTLEKTVPLIFCGIAAMISYKSGLFNIGLEGQMVMGAITYILVGLRLQMLPLPLHVLVCSAIAAAAGAIWAAIAGFMKVYCRANEVVSTIMLNHIAVLFTEYLVSGPFMAEGTIPQSEALDELHTIHSVIPGFKLTWAFVIAGIALVIIAIVFRYTVFGYNMIAAGDNPRAAEAGGIPMNRVRIQAMSLSGAVAGFGGGLLVAATYGRFVLDMQSGYGFDGLAIAVLGQNSAIGVFISSILFGGLRNGSLSMAMLEKVPSELMSILQGLIILTVSAPLLLRKLYRRKKQWK